MSTIPYGPKILPKQLRDTDAHTIHQIIKKTTHVENPFMFPKDETRMVLSTRISVALHAHSCEHGASQRQTLRDKMRSKLFRASRQNWKHGRGKLRQATLQRRKLCVTPRLSRAANGGKCRSPRAFLLTGVVIVLCWVVCACLTCVCSWFVCGLLWFASVCVPELWRVSHWFLPGRKTTTVWVFVCRRARSNRRWRPSLPH